MSGFKRSPSKFSWNSDFLEFRDACASPGSQDSGFSDTEIYSNSNYRRSKGNTGSNKENKRLVKSETKPKKNCTVDVNFYSEPTNKYKDDKVGDRKVSKKLFHEVNKELDKVSKKLFKIEDEETTSFVEPNKRYKFFSPKPTRKHFRRGTSPPFHRHTFSSRSNISKKIDEAKCLSSQSDPNPLRDNNGNSSEGAEECITHQYSPRVQETSNALNASTEATVYDSYAYCSDNPYEENNSKGEETEDSIGSDGKRTVDECQTSELPKINGADQSCGESDFDSDIETELENVVGNPRHTSTPKWEHDMGKRRRKESLPLNLFLKYQHERVPPIPVQPEDVSNEAVQMWLADAKNNYEQECMITLQCKSITAELNQKVYHLASCCSTIIRAILYDARRIEMEYEKLNSETVHIESLIQSLTGNILDFLTRHMNKPPADIIQLADKIRLNRFEDTLNLIAKLYSAWDQIKQEMIEEEVQNIVTRVECPISELDLRATITAVTSLALRHEELVEIFIRADLVSALLILCEKCEGSSLRCLILRSLATVCCNTSAVRQFERFSGIRLIMETLEEDSRPEPERAEAIALLVQVTAPWLDDNQSVKGLKECCYRLIKALTKFSLNTKCCQNLLLCVAALANLSGMDAQSAKYIVRCQSVVYLLNCVKAKLSVYLLEQVTTLIANISSSELARRHLIELNAPRFLLQSLKVNYEEDATKRLQQKSVIALSRLCGTKEGAELMVECGGVDKLVKLCRERKERFDSDAVLVAALATLRKIADACGTEVLNVQDAQELVQPKLLDSFLTYSAQSESYV